MNMTQLRADLSSRRLSVVARETGLHRNTVERIANGKQANPKKHTVELLTAYLSRNPAKEH
jgi:transcriptional regulator with XRE-family HTH domain